MTYVVLVPKLVPLVVEAGDLLVAGAGVARVVHTDLVFVRHTSCNNVKHGGPFWDESVK